MITLEKNTLHIVGQSHIDLAWFWSYFPETIYDCAKLTFTRAVDNLEMHKDYVFAQSQVPLYKDVEKHFPELFEKIRDYVKEGRWAIVGGMYVEAEGGEPSGESFVRQCLLGQRYFAGKFGKKINVGWLLDNWTGPWQLPQILKKSGMDSLVFGRGSKGDQIFWWEAPDGSRVLACKFLKGSFGSRPFPNLEELIRDMTQRYWISDVLMIIGRGDHGGGPTYQEIQNIKELASTLEPRLKIRFSTPQQYFEKLSEDVHRLPVLRDELDSELVGDLTNVSETKKKNRLSENLLLTAEKISSVVATLTSLKYPQLELNEAWKKVLFNQFHDIIGGSAIPSAQEDAHRLYEEVFQTGETVLRESLKALSSLVETSREEMNVFVFNSLSWNRTDIVEVEVEVPKNWKAFKLLDPEEKVTPIQIVGLEQEKEKVCVTLIFEAENIPSMGYKTYRIVPADETSHPNSITANEEEMENAFFRIRVSPTTGYVTSIFNKVNKREMIGKASEGNLLQLIEDSGNSEGTLTIGPDKDRLKKFTGFTWHIDSKPSIEVLESGPVRCRVRITREFHNSEYNSEILLYSKIKRVDFKLVTDWNEIHRALKVSFTLSIANPIPTFETQYGAITRPANGEEQPTQQWVDLSDSDGSYGVSLLNDSKYACDVRNDTVRLTILRSPTQPAYNTDKGIHEVGYSIFPHVGNWKSGGVVRKGYEFNNPLIPFIVAPTKGDATAKVEKISKNSSFLHVEPENLVLTVLKRVEDGEGLILRLYETAGRETQANISLNLSRAVKKAFKTNLLEDEKMEDEVNVETNLIKFKVSPYEIATIKLNFDESALF
jgi:alpha-mannosidase